MYPPKKILFPVDFSERCDAVAPMVETFVGRFEASLTLFHAVPLFDSAYGVPMTDLITPATELMSDYLAGDLKHFTVGRVVTVGDPALAIIDYAKDNGIDLIMIPTHGYGRFRRFVIGSITAKVLHDAACPVWTSAHIENAPALEDISFRHVLAAVDFGSESPCVLKWASEFAAEVGADLTVIHAVPTAQDVPGMYLDQDFKRELLGDARERAIRLLNRCGIQDARVNMVANDVVPAIAAAARQLQADLVVIGRSPATGLGRLRTHSYQVIRETPCPVLSM